MRWQQQSCNFRTHVNFSEDGSGLELLRDGTLAMPLCKQQRKTSKQVSYSVGFKPFHPECAPQCARAGPRFGAICFRFLNCIFVFGPLPCETTLVLFSMLTCICFGSLPFRFLISNFEGSPNSEALSGFCFHVVPRECLCSVTMNQKR